MAFVFQKKKSKVVTTDVIEMLNVIIILINCYADILDELSKQPLTVAVKCELFYTWFSVLETVFAHIDGHLTVGQVIRAERF